MLRVKKNKLSRHIADANWREFRTLLEYKCKRYGKNLLFIGRFDPSSKLCPCGHLVNLTLKDREWQCPECDETHDRDKLAAKNVLHFAFCKQNTKNSSAAQNKNNNLVPQELRELRVRKNDKTPVKICVSESLNQEASMALT